jgi:hypothetical protein
VTPLDFILQYWIEVLFGLIVAVLGILYKTLSRKLHKQICDLKSLRDGTQALLRNEIIRAYDKYTEQEWIPIYALENVLAMYQAYHDLGGNGTITKLVEELKLLQSYERE